MILRDSEALEDAIVLDNTKYPSKHFHGVLLKDAAQLQFDDCQIQQM